jgi:hypothetical protein
MTTRGIVLVYGVPDIQKAVDLSEQRDGFIAIDSSVRIRVLAGAGASRRSGDRVWIWN